MTELRSHVGGAVILETASSFSSSDPTMTLVGTPLGWPDGTNGPWSVRINKGEATEEKLYCLSRTGQVVTLAQHGYDDTTPHDHGAGEKVEVCGTALELAEANAHIMATTAVHGLGPGVAVVGDIATQTLTHKSMDGSVNTFSNIPRGASPQLQADIAALTTALAAEQAQRISGDNTNATALANEAADRIAGDNTNATAIAANAAAITAEATARAAADALLAPLASPTFTGHVTVPTPTTGADAVTKAYADALITTENAVVWTDIPLASGMIAYDNNTQYGRPAYYKDPLGFVHLRGLALLHTGTKNAATTLGTLPAGFRPPGSWVCPIISSGTLNQAVTTAVAGLLARLNIASDGTIQLSLINLTVADADWVSLDGVCFPTAW